LDISNGVLTYVAGAGVANLLTLSISGANYVLNDTAETITLGSGAIAAGFTGNGTNTVSGPNAAVSSLDLRLGDQSDLLTVQGLADSLIARGDGGTDSALVSGAINVGGSLRFDMEALTINGAISGVTTAELTGDTIAINAAISASTSVLLKPFTALRDISLGTEVVGQMSLTDVELDFITTPFLRIGVINGGDIAINAALTIINSDALSLITGATITQTAPLAVNRLSISAAGNVTLANAANDIDVLAANIIGASATLSFTDVDNFSVGIVDGNVGISASTSGGIVVLSAGSALSGGPIITNQLAVIGGPVTLTNTGNDITNLAGQGTVAGMPFTITDADDLSLTTISGINGVSTNNGNISIVTVNGPVLIANTAAADDVNAGTGTVSITAGSLAAASFEISNSTGGTIRGLGGVTLAADRLTIGGSITGGPVRFQPFDPATAIDLGGADGPTTLSLTIGELDLVTTSSLTIGGTKTTLTVVAPLTSINAASLTLIADRMAINADVAVSTRVVLQPFSPGTLIDLGAKTAGRLSLTDSELDRFIVPALEIGSIESGHLNLAGAIAPANAMTLVLVSGATIDQSISGVALTATNLGLRADARIGSFVASLLTAVTRLEAVTFGGGIFLTNSGSTLSIGGVDVSIDGVQVTTSGNVALINVDNSIILDGVSTEDIRSNAGNVSVTATGATSNVETRNDSADAIDSNLGSVSVSAGQDILVGSATVDNFGDLEANGDLFLAAGRDIIVDENAFVDVFGTGTIMATAGHNVAFLASDGTTGSRMTTEGGAITIITAAGGTFTSASGNASGVLRSTGGAITISADDITIDSPIVAMAGTVTLRPVTASRAIDLGTETAGQLSLTDAEVDRITASLLRIGTEASGAITISAAISPAIANILSLVTASGIADTGAGALTITNLALTAATVDLDGTNSVTNLAGTAAGISATSFRFDNTGPLTIAPSIDGSSGLTAANGAINLTAPAIVVTALLDADGITTFTGNTTFGSAVAFSVDIAGLTAGTEYDQLSVTGTVVLDGALQVVPTFAAGPGDQFILLANDGVDPITGTFLGLPEGALIDAGTGFFQISYSGGDGNDVVLTARVGDITISANGKSATFTEADGDIVTVKITRGTLDGTELKLFPVLDDSGRGSLLQLNLGDEFDGTSLSITARRGATGGNGFVNVGFIDASGIDLGPIKVGGDLGRVEAGAVKSLTVQSLGALGLSTQSPGGNLTSQFSGKLGKLTVKSSIHGATILGSDSIGAVNVLGSIFDGRISAGADLGTVTVRGDIVGMAGAPVIISAFGKSVAPGKGTDLAFKSLKVGGGVEFLRVLTGYDLNLAGANADAAIGAITVGADCRASSVLAGVTAGLDGLDGTTDDAKIASPARDNPAIVSRIASITIKGQALGTLDAGDSFGIVAEQIGRAKVGSVLFPFKKGPNTTGDFFTISSTNDFAIGELVM
jgi:hypothetical protein